MAKGLIQRFTSSNPSPRYVQTVAEAFKTGTYGGTTYGGRYGDLGATVVAILSDREARSITLDAAPTQGLLREPIIKVWVLVDALCFLTVLGDMCLSRLSRPIVTRAHAPRQIVHILRALEYESKDGREIRMVDLSGKVGQAFQQSPSVFNFYKPVSSLFALSFTATIYIQPKSSEAY